MTKIFKKLNPKLLLVILILGTMLESKKCSKNPIVTPPPSNVKKVKCYTGSYSRYQGTGSCYSSPAQGSDPDLALGTCTEFYTSYFGQTHYTKIYLQWASDPKPYGDLCWDNGGMREFDVPTQIPIGKTLYILFESKEKCTTCYDPSFSNKATRTIWKDVKIYTSGSVVEDVIEFKPYWSSWAYDVYCR